MDAERPIPGPIVDVVVLAGGRGRRLGRDKATLEVAGQRQVERVVARVRPLGGTVVVARGDRPLAVTSTVEVADEPGVAGPLAGVLAGLAAVRSEHVAIVAVDLVAPNATLLAALAAHVRARELTGAMPLVGEWPQPLHAVVARSCREALLAASTASASLVAAFDAAGVTRVPESRWRPWAPSAHPADDLDTPADLHRLGITPG